jgi:hypothetical protein
VTTIGDFYDKLRKWQKDGQAPLFDTAEGEGPRTSLNPGGATVTWSFDLDLKGGPKR